MLSLLTSLQTYQHFRKMEQKAKTDNRDHSKIISYGRAKKRALNDILNDTLCGLVIIASVSFIEPISQEQISAAKEYADMNYNGKIESGKEFDMNDPSTWVGGNKGGLMTKAKKKK